MRLAVLPSRDFGTQRDTSPRFGIPHLLTVLLLVAALPAFAVGAVVALPIGAAVLSIELARKALAAPGRG